MAETMTCLNCGTKTGEKHLSEHGWIWYVGQRPDQRFCSKACVSAYHREHGKPHLHADLPRDTGIQCKVCGEWFDINDYADRGGQRQPLYCSSKCRQKAYRQRKRGGAANKVRNART